MKKEVITKLKSYLFENDIIIIGCSGGPDSMFLLDLLRINFKALKIVCANVDHNLRPASKAESAFVKEYCQQFNIIYEGLLIKDGPKYNEAELRKKRYKFFKQLKEKYQAKYILTAHHGDDLIETILMRIVRGSNLKGYAGFKYLTEEDNLVIIKPLLGITKEEIISSLQKDNIPYVEDSSNYEDDYTRNRYRHYVLPFLKKEDPKVHQKFINFSNELLKYSNYIDNIVNQKMKTIKQTNKYNIVKLKKLDDLIQAKIIEKIMADIYKDNLNLVNSTHVDLIKKMINNKNANDSIFLPNKIEAVKEYDNLIFTKNKVGKSYQMILEEETMLPNGKTLRVVSSSSLTNNYCTRLNNKEIKLPLLVRSKKNGDFISIKNMNGHKKIKDIFIDAKVPLRERKDWPLVIDSNGQIVWLPGLKKTHFDKSKSEKYDIIIEYV